MPASTEGIRFAGDVNIEKIEVISLNGFGQEITNQVLAIEIFEDMFSPFISGVLAVKESVDFANLFPFTGEEFVNIKISTPSFSGKGKVINDQFYIYKINNRLKTGDRQVAYEIHFFSREAMVDLNKKISTKYEGKISDIAKTIITDSYNGLESKKDTNIEYTPNGNKFISNYWSPVKSLNYIAETAQNLNGSSGYLFFENRKGFNFVSTEYLYTQEAVQEFIYDQYIRDFNKDGTTVRNVEEEYKRIIDIEFPSLFDYIDRSRMGMFASKMIAYDVTTKKFLVKNFDMLDEFSNTKHLNNYPLTSKKNIRKNNSMVINFPKYYNNFNNYADVTNSKTVQKRISLIQQAEANKVNIVVPGRTDYTVGNKIYLRLNKFNPIDSSDSDKDVLDQMFSGNYLISAINHTIDREKHQCHMQLIKDSFIMDLDANKGK